MVRLTVIVLAVFLGIYLLSCWLDKRQDSPNFDAVVSEGAGRVLITISVVVVILLFVLIFSRFDGLFQTTVNFLQLVRTLLPLWPIAANICIGHKRISKGITLIAFNAIMLSFFSSIFSIMANYDVKVLYPDVISPPTFGFGINNVNKSASLVLCWGVFSLFVVHKRLAWNCKEAVGERFLCTQ